MELKLDSGADRLPFGTTLSAHLVRSYGARPSPSSVFRGREGREIKLRTRRESTLDGGQRGVWNSQSEWTGSIGSGRPRSDAE